MTRIATLGIAFVFAMLAMDAQAASILFIGNSFTYGHGTPVRTYRADSITDLNRQGMGGVPALFKAFTVEAGIDYDVYLEASGSVGIQWHIDHRMDVIGERSWDVVVLQSFSTLDPTKPGDPAALIRSVERMTQILQRRNPAVEVFLDATWPRADLAYATKGKWYGLPIETMARDVRAGYDKAAAATPGVRGVIPVGDAWVRAMRTGVADANPYDGVDPGKVNLWGTDDHHASIYGYYLESLVAFGSITGLDPRTLREGECAGFELGLSPAQIGALQQVAFDQLAADGFVKASPPDAAFAQDPGRCIGAR